MTLVLYHTRAQPKRTIIPICRDYCDAPGQPPPGPTASSAAAASPSSGPSRPTPAGVEVARPVTRLALPRRLPGGIVPGRPVPAGVIAGRAGR
jgi:hypothetical protein